MFEIFLEEWFIILIYSLWQIEMLQLIVSCISII